MVPIPRRVRLRPGRFTGPVVLGWVINLLMLCAVYDVVRPLWVIFCRITKGHSPLTVPVPPWDTFLGVPLIKTPTQALVQIAVASVVFFGLRWVGEVLVWRGKREKDLLVKGRAMTARVVKAESEGGKHTITYQFTRDGELQEQEVRVKTPRALNDEVIVLFSFDYSHEMLYEHCRYQLA